MTLLNQEGHGVLSPKDYSVPANRGLKLQLCKMACPRPVWMLLTDSH